MYSWGFPHLRITHINAYDVSGGAARAAYRLHRGLRGLGHDSRMLVQQKDSSDANVVQFSPRRDLARRVLRRIERIFLENSRQALAWRPEGASYFSDDRSEYGAEILSHLPDSDVLHLHWVAGVFDYRDFFPRIPRDLPVVWTLHDMNPFTGGCHFDGGCGRFMERCGACPQIGSSNGGDFSAHSWKRKKRAFEALAKRSMRIVTPSHWLREEVAKSSLLGGFAPTVIPYGLDTEIYQPRERKAAREQFGIPEDAKVVLFVADWANEKRKGLALLIEAIRSIEGIPELCMATLGRAMLEREIGRRRISINYVNDEATMSRVYSAADVFVIPSLQDNFPNTALEAMACGVPTVGFAAGGLVDIVREGKTGKLVKTGNVGAFGGAVAELLRDDSLRMRMAEESRRVAVEEYRLEIQARRYEALYENLVEASKGGQR